MATVAEFLVSVSANIDNFENQMSRTSKSLKNIGDKAKEAGKTLTASVTAPIVGLGAAAVVSITKFEDQMAKVQAVSGATGKEMEKLEAQAKELGSTTQFSASQAASAQEFLARAGFKTAETLEALPAVLNLAAASGTDLGRAADITSNIMGGFSIEAGESARVADVLAKATGSANVDMNQLAESMKVAAPAANAAGISMEETAAAIGILGNAGIQGSEAGTALQGGLVRLTKPAKEAAELMEELGIEVFNTDGTMKNLQGIISEVGKGTEGLNQQQKNAAIATIFGQEALKGWLTLLETGPEELGNFTTELQNSTGTSEEMATIMNDTLGGSFRSLLSALEGLALSFADTLIPPIQKATEFLTKVARKFSELSPTAQKVILVVAGIAAAIGPLLIVAGFLASAIASITTAATILTPILGAVALPILGIIAAIAAAIAIGILIVKNWDTIKTKGTELWNRLKQAFANGANKVKQSIDGIITKGRNFVSSFGSFFTIIPRMILNLQSSIFRAGASLISSLISGIRSKISSVGKSIGSVANKIRDFLPFSDAKEGPLSQLSKVDFGSPLMMAMKRSIPDLGMQLNNQLQIPSFQPSMTQEQQGMVINNTFNLNGLQVRNDEDIQKISEKLFRLQQDKLRQRGVRV